MIRITTSRAHLLFLALMLVIAGWAIGFLMALPEPGSKVLPRCEYEDSRNCWWDGGMNGDGSRFIRMDGQSYYPEFPETQLVTK